MASTTEWMGLLLNTPMGKRSGGLMTSVTAWMALLWNTLMEARSGGFLGCARNKTEMLGINGMRWYIATALECSSVVVDTMSWRGMITHEKEKNGWIKTLYRKVKHRLDGPAVECADGTKTWWINGKRHRADGPAVGYADGQKEWDV